MTVGGIYDPYHSGYDIRQIQTPYVEDPAKTVRTAEEPEQKAPADIPEQDAASDVSEPVKDGRSDRTVDLNNVSLTFNREEDFGYIGMDSDPEGLDMQKAISDMQKDRILQNYQYFIEGAGSLFGGQPSADGTVVLKP